MKSLLEVVNESRNKEWGKDEFVTWEEIAYYQNHQMEMSEKNRDNSLAKGYPENELCAFCGKPLKPGYRVIRMRLNKDRDAEYYYNSTIVDGEELRCGSTCFKALQQAHDAKYGG